jgi:hypothetical protein
MIAHRRDVLVRRLIDDWAARRIDQPSRRLHESELGGPELVFGAVSGYPID